MVPQSLKFTTTKRGLAARRVPVKLRPEQQTYASNNNKLIQIKIPNTALFDTRKGYITFDVGLTTTGGTYKRMHNGIFSCINRLRMLAGSTEIEDIQDWNRIYSILWAALNPSEVVSAIAHTAMGFGTQVERDALGAATTSYCCPLYSGILNSELLPTRDISSNLMLELYIEDGTVCVETDGTVPIITISNILFHVERLELDPAYMEFISSYIRSNGLQFGFHTWQRYINSLPASSSQQLLINHRSSSMNGMLNILVNSANINDPTVNDRFLTWPAETPNGAVWNQTKLLINAMPFPDEPIDLVQARKMEPYQMYCRWAMKWNLNGFLAIAPPITNDSFTIAEVGRFLQVDDLEAYPEEPNVINAFTTLAMNSTILKMIQFSKAIDAGFQLDSWVEYFRQIGLTSNGKIVILQ